MRFVALDAKQSGTLTLEDDTSRLVVLQDRPGWTDRTPGAPWTVAVPPWARTAELWGWDGLRKTQPVEGMSSLSLDVPGGETHMLVFRRG
jgi:hypothetical protein